jgi:Cdc6-like AAA superfamily ATPase
MENKITLWDVFTPTKPAFLTFVERETINTRLVDAIKTPGKQLVIYGHTGSGKTTLLINKLNQVYENHLTTRCMTGMTMDHILLNAFDQLNKFYDSERIDSKSVNINSSLGAEYLGLKAKIGSMSQTETHIKQQRIIPPQLTAQRLAMFIGEAHCCWVLEDFHKIPDNEKYKLSQVMKIFVDMAFDYPHVKVIAIGAVNTAREIVQYDREMANRVAEISVPLMTKEELKIILEKGENLLNIDILNRVKKGTIQYSNGLASVCHQLSLNVCNAANVIEPALEKITITEECFDKALNEYIENESDSIKAAFDKALKQPINHPIKTNPINSFRLILESLAECEDEDGMTKEEILYSIKKKTISFPSNVLSAHLNQLQKDTRGAVIRCDITSGNYTFQNPFYRVYALIRLIRHRLPKDRERFVYEMRKLSEELWEKSIDNGGLDRSQIPLF